MIHGCSGDNKREIDERVLIRAGGSVVTVRAFHEAFESSITSPSLLFQNPDALLENKYRVLNRLSEELLILERARELNLQVDEEEVDRVINDFKKDFPDDTFEQTLMENGISFLTWKKALKRRLLMEKVIRRDLSEQSFATPLALNETRETGAAENPPENGAAGAGGSEIPPAPETEKPAGVPPHTIAAESEYPNWIKRLKQQYAIEIDWELWEIIEQEQVDGD